MMMTRTKICSMRHKIRKSCKGTNHLLEVKDMHRELDLILYHQPKMKASTLTQEANNHQQLMEERQEEDSPLTSVLHQRHQLKNKQLPLKRQQLQL